MSLLQSAPHCLGVLMSSLLKAQEAEARDPCREISLFRVSPGSVYPSWDLLAFSEECRVGFTHRLCQGRLFNRVLGGASDAAY